MKFLTVPYLNKIIEIKVCDLTDNVLTIIIFGDISSNYSQFDNIKFILW